MGRKGTRRWRSLAAAVAIATLVGAACGDDDDDDAGGEATEETAADSGAEASDTTAAGAETTAAGGETGGDTGTTADVDPLVMSVATEPSTLDVQAVIDRNSRVFTDNIFESLLARDENAELVPLLATEYESVDDTTWRFTLREGVTFHNGEPFDAEAAAASINRVLAEDYETQRTSYIQDIVEAKVVDAMTIDVVTDGVNAVLPIQMTQLGMVPPVASAEPDFGENPVGTGPYQFVEWNRGQEIVAEANPDYWGGPPQIPGFSVRIIPDAQTALAALQTGEVDIVLDLLPEQKDLVPNYLSVPATEFSYIGFNTYKPELEKPEVRVAMNMAIDKELIAETIYSGEARPSRAQMLSPESLGFNDSLQDFPYDPEAAQEMLAQAGYPDGFELELFVPIGRYLKLEEAALVVADQLADIGITANINQVEFNTFREDGRIPGTEPGAYDLKMAWNSNEWFDASRIVSHITCEGTSSKYCDPEVDELMDEGVSTLDQDARQRAYEQVWAKLHESPHAIYLLQQNLIYGTSDRVVWEPRLDDTYYVSQMELTS
jgi:peptide/nickel transport system substrate-binding protein